MDIKYLYKKFTDKYWNIQSDNIYPTEGSDKLILHVNLVRLRRITFIVTKNKDIYHPNEENEKNDKTTYKTAGGTFFPYLVKSKVDLSRFQIISQLNEKPQIS